MNSTTLFAHHGFLVESMVGKKISIMDSTTPFAHHGFLVESMVGKKISTMDSTTPFAHHGFLVESMVGKKNLMDSTTPFAHHGFLASGIHGGQKNLLRITRSSWSQVCGHNVNYLDIVMFQCVSLLYSMASVTVNKLLSIRLHDRSNVIGRFSPWIFIPKCPVFQLLSNCATRS